MGYENVYMGACENGGDEIRLIDDLLANCNKDFILFLGFELKQGKSQPKNHKSVMRRESKIKRQTQ